MQIITFFIFVLFLCFVVTNWETAKKHRFIIVFALLPFSGFGQLMSFDYYINLTGSDSLYVESATIEIQPDYIEVKTPYEFFSRYIVATGADREGDKMYFFNYMCYLYRLLIFFYRKLINKMLC